jgi:hypothetical protein
MSLRSSLVAALGECDHAAAYSHASAMFSLQEPESVPALIELEVATFEAIAPRLLGIYRKQILLLHPRPLHFSIHFHFRFHFHCRCQILIQIRIHSSNYSQTHIQNLSQSTPFSQVPVAEP